MENKNTVERSILHLIGCGGAGSSIVNDIAPKLNELGNSFSDVTVRMLDTTEKTVQAFPEHRKNFTRITSSRLSVDEIDGMAGERKNPELAKDINEAVIKYVDEKLYLIERKIIT